MLLQSQDGDIYPLPALPDAWPTLNSSSDPTDTDGDGMPDDWEKSKGLDSNKYDANQKNLSTAYDNIEVYINSLVVDITNDQKE